MQKRTDNTSNTKSKAFDKALDILHKGVADLMSSDGWRQALEFRTKFYNYSFFNTSLILAQCPEASYVAGYRKWQSLDRQVKKGERSIKILAPLTKKNKDTGETELFGFRTVSVFDISQTDGEVVPEIPRPQLLQGDNAGILQVIDKLILYGISQDLTISDDLDYGRAMGVYRPASKTIKLRVALPPLQKLKTLIHELAHAELHSIEDKGNIAELEAESCAYLVCHSLGLDTSSYSFAYLANWADSLEQLIAAGEKASKAATKTLTALDTQLNPVENVPVSRSLAA